MRPTLSLLQNARLTLYSRLNCGLCETAKLTLNNLRQRKTFEYAEIDVMAPGNQQWKDMYEFDVPVLHVEKTLPNGQLSDPKKLFHRFTETEVQKAIDEC
ncbi:hypothetical protein H112_00866 [Trichophyton rubrum D6]|uniref:Glutaredoxin-like protein n=6 Tax=Trichophyton TaxID=5550 RepID=D4B5D8_ARTBC|nr:uncharacterized protein ARB_03678 [Trichophyton benhamiae CBS 112371]XP_047607428.1 uncharacterized protein TERG_12623 [Trichophyton rubrum CBS 118892]EZF27055.1 hypothetical protein H100_00864 [Trichophyton rubrum MR850]EZF46150.1 hypothetical protein H102_00856 [Trichophyton rubrum CBS 100081]EZF56766.1 hypothetical protein H103_00864 [Trichophyton rubrum CBS 288.86]EZF67407.1 hypothetical protein H104_00848 [Trichophyton rubrum CBS 289.86]EZF78007.1 hypothetical protein H105_00862 [Tric